MENHTAQAILNAINKQSRLLEELKEEIQELKEIGFCLMTSEQKKEYRDLRIQAQHRKMKKASDKRSQE